MTAPLLVANPNVQFIGRSDARRRRPVMSIKQFRLSAQARDQLIRLKTRTGIAQWNILGRWAFCLSLRQPTPPTPLDVPSDSNVEMTWQVFGGDAHELYLALLTERCARDGLGTSDDVLLRQFRLHLQMRRARRRMANRRRRG